MQLWVSVDLERCVTGRTVWNSCIHRACGITVAVFAVISVTLQDCHRPPVTEDVNDPRFVWYCCKCAKNLKKIVSITTRKTLFHQILVAHKKIVIIIRCKIVMGDWDLNPWDWFDSLKIRFSNWRMGFDLVHYLCDSIWAMRFDSRIVAGCCLSVLFSV